VNCWAHVLRNIDTELNKIESDTRLKIRHDIVTIQVLSTEQQFLTAIRLFDEKWKKLKDAKIDAFLSYFQTWCVNGRNGWYRGYLVGKPSTSNSLESKHRSIKDFSNNRLRKRLPLKQATEEMFRLVEKWSRRHNPISLVKGFNEDLIEVENSNFEPFHSLPVFSTKDWTDAYAWQRRDKRVVKVGSKYYMGSNDTITITDEDAKAYEK
jgi:hypothetical protein